MTEHTPTPWHVGATMYTDLVMAFRNNSECVLAELDAEVDVPPEENAANADFIVKAVNEHDALVAEVARLRALSPRAKEPDNLPDGWEFDAKTNCVTCSGCAFRFGAEHPDGDGAGWTCPVCSDGNGTEAKQTVAAHRETQK